MLMRASCAQCSKEPSTLGNKRTSRTMCCKFWLSALNARRPSMRRMHAARLMCSKFGRPDAQRLERVVASNSSSYMSFHIFVSAFAFTVSASAAAVAASAAAVAVVGVVVLAASLLLLLLLLLLL